jgi:arylformamidase
MRVFDISLTVTPDMVVWPGDPPVRMRRMQALAAGDMVNMTELAMSVHTGTHVDAPAHFLAGGKTIEQLNLDALVGPCRVVQVPDDVSLLAAQVLEALPIPERTERLLIKSRNSDHWRTPGKPFQTEFVAVDESGAEWLVQRGVRLIGVDYLSVAPFDAPLPAHVVCLQAEMILLEGLDLGAVPPGDYLLCCLPLKLAGSDGAPARTVLIEL